MAIPKRDRVKRTRCQLDLDPPEMDVLKRLASSNRRSQTDVMIKALRILDSLDREEIYLMTPEGSKIPKSVVFS